MRRPFLIAVLGLGSFLGYGSAIFHHVHGYGHTPLGSDRREAFERHIADVCTESAVRAAGKSTSTPAVR
jgi:hypothetical protein